MRHMLTTVDNPFDPFDDFDAWFTWDCTAGYNSSSLLARVARTSDELSEADLRSAIEQAIDEIVQEDVMELFIKVSRDIESEQVPLEEAS